MMRRRMWGKQGKSKKRIKEMEKEGWKWGGIQTKEEQI